MGLAEPRKRTKISNDPNNTKWTRSDTGYGHKILAAQGWTPGSFLGAQNAPHASSFTAANASHIRVALKDDNLGLGAQKHGPVEKQRTGLDAFQGLLGRLNGKTDLELEKEKKRLDEQQSTRYLQTRWSLIHFVKGGLLVQEKITLPSPTSTKPPQVTADGDMETRDIVVENDGGQGALVREASSDSETKKFSKRKRRRDGRERDFLNAQSADVEPVADSPATSLPDPTSTTGQSKRKEKKKRHRTTEDDERGEHWLSQVKLNGGSTGTQKGVSASSSSPSTPTSSSHPRQVEGRHALRNRNIMQKKMAVMDSKALDEIFARM